MIMAMTPKNATRLRTRLMPWFEGATSASMFGSNKIKHLMRRTITTDQWLVSSIPSPPQLVVCRVGDQIKEEKVMMFEGHCFPSWFEREANGAVVTLPTIASYNVNAILVYNENLIDILFRHTIWRVKFPADPKEAEIDLKWSQMRLAPMMAPLGNHKKLIKLTMIQSRRSSLLLDPM